MENDAGYACGDIKLHALNILLEFDRIAQKHNLRYFIIDGTLLGAVRHEGFIPWDDDIDVGVMRSDYERLLSMDIEWASSYMLDHFDIDKEYIYPYAKLYDTSTTVIENLRIEFKRGVWIDIFPLDGTFKNLFVRRLHCLLIGWFRRAFVFRATLTSGYTFDGEKKKKIKQIAGVFMRFVPLRVLYGMLNSLLRWRTAARAPYIGNIIGPWGVKEALPRHVFLDSEATEKFCGFRFPAPSDSHSYLKSVYGNYMDLPPVEHRKGHQSSYIDLSKGYHDRAQ